MSLWRKRNNVHHNEQKPDHLVNILPNLSIQSEKAMREVQRLGQEIEQEPVVWMYVNKSTHEVRFQKHMRDFVDHGAFSEVPLYSEPLANQEKTSGSPIKELNCICGAVWEGEELVHIPPRHKPLTDDEIGNLINEFFYLGMEPSFRHYANFARAIEIAHKIKEQK